jgi:dUTP pyrophosphatase
MTKIINNSNNSIPEYETELSAGMDIRAHLPEGAFVLKASGRAIIKTGLSIQLKPGHEAQIRPRSGLSIKHGITVLNSPGTVDADFTGEIGVILINLSNDDFVIEDGDRIAQMVIAKYEQASWVETDKLDETERGSGGFGSTGNK